MLPSEFCEIFKNICEQLHLDLAGDERLTKSDIVCLAETQLTPNKELPENCTIRALN